MDDCNSCKKDKIVGATWGEILKTVARDPKMKQLDIKDSDPEQIVRDAIESD